MEIAAADSLYKAKLIPGFDDVDGMGTATWRSGKSPAYFKRGDYVLVLKHRRLIEHASSPRSYPKSLHMSMSLAPSASDPTSTRKSLIMERMGDKYIVKRAFKTFQKSYDFTSCVNEQLKQLLVNQNPEKATSILSRQKENGRYIYVLVTCSCLLVCTETHHHLQNQVTWRREEVVLVLFVLHLMDSKATTPLRTNKQKELSKSSATSVEKTRLLKNSKARRDSLNPKAKPMQSSLPVRTFPKGSSEKVL
ncbi:hypothetical protein DY000_02055406 [Brassica cretica]|uniref:Uncharacterized protein n=1 Tax=Brassica cretica TaxID=69181 RepID=A0ABQ7AK88_BRACR|nr:hypothetical protein DY000_02055406 [Brassica cretica]